MSFPINNHPGFVFLPGTTPVIISAPHCVEHIRNGAMKFSEPETSVLAQHLHNRLDVSSIYKTSGDGHDANSEESSYFRDAIVNVCNNKNIICGIDLHQCSPNRDQDIIIGTGKGTNINDDDIFINALKKVNKHYNFHIVYDEIFPALGRYRVSTDVNTRTSVPYIQFELNTSLFLNENNRVVDFLSDFINIIMKEKQGII